MYIIKNINIWSLIFHKIIKNVTNILIVYKLFKMTYLINLNMKKIPDEMSLK
jgi:hypothetical protein